jgi:uncharacterized protein YsxB (DUF464 family)
MTRINYCREGELHRLSIKGHAGQAEKGRDIVCAAVSALAFALLGYLIANNAQIDAIQADDGEIGIDCRGGDEAFAMAVTGFTQIAEAHPQYVELYIAANGG